MSLTDPYVLVVDDDATVRKVLRIALERAQMRVETAGHGVEALAVIAGATEDFDLILTDVVMPEMGGVALAEQAIKHPNPPHIMFMSGFNHDPARLRYAGRSAPFVQKPFDMDDVVRRVRTLIGIG